MIDHPTVLDKNTRDTVRGGRHYVVVVKTDV